MNNLNQKSRTFTRSRSPDSNSSRRPVKRRRTWSDEVQRKALANGTETDKHRLAQRQRQIDFGKNTIAYDKFSAVLPREKRVKGDPMTPLARQKCSKRSFAGQITSWKKKIYQYVEQLENSDGDQAATCKPKHDESAPVSADSLAPSAVDKEVAVQSQPENDNTVQKHEHNESNLQSEEEQLSDLDDIELDDFGNVIESQTIEEKVEERAEVTEKSTRDESPPSIFDTYS